MTTLEKKQKAIRESHLDLFRTLQQTLAEVGEEMLGTDNWDTDVVDGMLETLSTEIKEHFGENE